MKEVLKKKFKLKQWVVYMQQDDMFWSLRKGQISSCTIHPDKSVYYDIDPTTNGGRLTFNLPENYISLNEGNLLKDIFSKNQQISPANKSYPQ